MVFEGTIALIAKNVQKKNIIKYINKLYL